MILGGGERWKGRVRSKSTGQYYDTASALDGGRGSEAGSCGMSITQYSIVCGRWVASPHDSQAHMRDLSIQAAVSA